jgi:hypothetical protein
MSYIIENLTNLNAVKLSLNIPYTDTTQDAAINKLITQASAAITNYCCRPFWLATNPGNPLTEIYSGNNDEWLVLNFWPVQAVLQVWENEIAYWQTSNFTSNDLLVLGNDYALVIDTPSGASKSGMLMRINGWWQSQYNIPNNMLSPVKSCGYGNVQVQYTYGFNQIPDDISYVCDMVVARMYNSMGFGVLASAETDQEYSWSADSPSSWLGVLNSSGLAILAKWKILNVSSF